MAERSAILLINHGSRQPHAADFANGLAARLRRDDPDRAVAVSFLELNRPSPGDALQQLALEGVTDVQVVPLLFTAGYHYRIDVPAAVAAVRDCHPELRVLIAAPLLGNAEGLIVALDARLREASGPDGSAEEVPDGLVLLAAGSSEPRARASVAALAEAWGRVHRRPAEVAFCDLAGDDVRAAIMLLHARGARRVACGSLFLASGRLLAAGRRAARDAGAIAVAGPLGMTPALVDLVRRRCLEPIPAG